MLREYISMHFSGAPVVPDLLTDESYLQPYDGSGSGSGSSKVNRFFSVPRGDPSRLYVEREDPNLTYLMTHPQFGATRAIAGTYTCLAVGENSNTSQDITVQLSGNSVLQHSIVGTYTQAFPFTVPRARNVISLRTSVGEDLNVIKSNVLESSFIFLETLV